MAAPLVFRWEWIVQINEMLNHDDDNPLPNTPAILRVATPLLKMKPEAYIPKLLSFGPYHHSKLEKAIDSDSPCAERNISMHEAYKGKFADFLSNELHSREKNFKYIVEMMKEKRPEIESFYRWTTSTDGEYSHNFDLMMAIDSSFILQFFITTHNCSWKWLDDEKERFLIVYYSCICHDIEKMENQIPLFVLKEVFDYVKEALQYRFSFNHLLQEICSNFCPFTYLDIAENERNILKDAMAKEPHFLGCLHKSLSLFLDMQPRGEEHHRRMRILLKKLVTWILRFLPTVPRTELQPCAGQLDKAGIKFKSFSKMPDYIGLDKESGTLYLPRIIVGDTIGTEVCLRNMLALEFNDALRPKYVTRYVALMSTLVQSPDDVRLLVDRQLISRGYFSLTDECMAQMWHDLRQPFLGGQIEVHSEILQTLNEWFVKSYWKNKIYWKKKIYWKNNRYWKKIARKVCGVWKNKRYWKKKIARKVCGVYEYVSSWKFIAPLAAFLGLLMTAIQTYCSLYHCSR